MSTTNSLTHNKQGLADQFTSVTYTKRPLFEADWDTAMAKISEVRTLIRSQLVYIHTHTHTYLQ